MTTESDRYVRRRRWDGTVAHMENARAKGGLTLGSSIFAVEVSVCWPYPGRGVQFAASPGRWTLQAGFSRGWRGWTPPHARLAKRGEKAGQEEPVSGSEPAHPGIVLRPS